jgi:hypothetical protein
MKTKSEIDYLKINKDSWDNRTAFHLKSDFYDVKSFLKGRSSLNSIELGLLGNLENKKVSHFLHSFSPVVCTFK